MSRIGNRILQIPEKVTVSVDGNIVKVTGPKGELSTEINPNITVNIKDNEVVVEKMIISKIFMELQMLLLKI